MYPLSYMIGLAQFKDGAWFEPSDDGKVAAIVSLLDIHPGEKIVDLGSGDGKVVIALAQAGADAYGIEKDEKLVHQAKSNIQKAGLAASAHIIHGNFWDLSFSAYDKVCLYQFKTIMARLERKLSGEMPSNTFVVSNHWEFPNWKPDTTINDIYLYKIP